LTDLLGNSAGCVAEDHDGGHVKPPRPGAAPPASRIEEDTFSMCSKDVDAVVAVCEKAGLAPPVARLRPIGVVKG
jgi:hypothetical protein